MAGTVLSFLNIFPFCDQGIATTTEVFLKQIAAIHSVQSEVLDILPLVPLYYLDAALLVTRCEMRQTSRFSLSES